MAKVSFREQVLKAREEAIVSSVNRLLAEKGFDVMTVDEVAADVGIAKASLYKHFTSKEALAAAARPGTAATECSTVYSWFAPSHSSCAAR
jgi:TetR/AcrR family transcriptional regulator, regulator of autoinduction and epiphytic fitness